MPASDGGDTQAVLRGLFRSFISSAAQHVDTATVWDNLRNAAANFAAGTAASLYGSEATQEQIDTLSTNLLRGITIQDVNNYRSLAGQYVQAAQNATQNPADQFEARDIFVAPWSKLQTTNGAIRQYRANVTFTANRITETGIEEVLQTRSYLIGPTLTNGDDLMAAAKSWYGRLPYNTDLTDIDVTDYALEAV